MLVAALALGLWAMPVPVLAYVDPGVGSMVTQLILGGIAGVTVLIRLFWNRIKSFFTTKIGRRRTKK